jgi:multidrug resistance efflux pump
MRATIFFVFLTIFSYAQSYYARVQPISKAVIKAEVSARVLVAKKELEGKIVNELIIKLDDKLDRIDLKNSKESLKLIKESIKLNSNLLPLLKKNAAKKEKLYKKVLPLNSTSVSQKDSLFNAYVSAKSQLSATKEKILNLKSQKVNLEQKIAALKDKIAKKNIIIKNRYLYEILVERGEFVNIGTPLAIIYDTSKAKLMLFLSEEDLKDLNNKTIYIDGKKTDLKFSKVLKIADSKDISSYKAEIIINPVYRFSKLVKVELK